MKTKHGRNVGSYGVDENWSVWMFGKNFLDSSGRGKGGGGRMTSPYNNFRPALYENSAGGKIF
jgi:hypothetical protein